MSRVKCKVTAAKGKSGTKVATYAVKARKSSRPKGELLFAPQVSIGLDIKYDAHGRPRRKGF